MEVNILILLSLLVAIIFYFYKLMTRHHNFFNKRGIAYKYPKIFFGNYYEAFLEFENHETVLKDLYNEFTREKLFGVFMFLRPVIIVKDFDLIRQITVVHSNKFMNRDRCTVADSIMRKSIFHLDGSHWIHIKEAIEPFLKDTSKFYTNISYNADILMNYLIKKHKDEKHLVIDTKSIFDEFLSNIIANVILGKDNDDDYGGNNAVYTIAKQINDDLTSFKGGMKLLIMTHFPMISKLFRLKIFHHTIYDFLRENVIEEIELRAKQKNENRHDFLQYMIKHNSNIDHDMISAHVFTFLSAGFTSTSKLFQACCFELAKNEDIQNELNNELNHSNSIENSKFFNLFILEVLRKWTPIENLNRICNEDCTIELKNGEKLKFFKGDLIQIPLSLIHNDYRIFNDPKYFNPHRFDNEEISKIELVLPFGIGPRRCICSQFAVYLVKLVLSKTLQRFRFVLIQNKPEKFSFYNEFNSAYVTIKLKD